MSAYDGGSIHREAAGLAAIRGAGNVIRVQRRGTDENDRSVRFSMLCAAAVHWARSATSEAQLVGNGA
jgi:hypothetical protein